MTMRMPVCATLFLAAVASACGERTGQPQQDGAAQACDSEAARAVVGELGTRMGGVSLLAPDSIVEFALRAEYQDLVTADLLNQWIAEPTEAPGRLTSSPWPGRIEIRAVNDLDGACSVQGDIVNVTSTGEETGRDRAEIEVRNEDGWRVSRWRSIGADSPDAADTTAAADAETDEDAAGVIREYYAAIAARDYDRAYALWASEGSASGQSFEDFEDGFSGTARVTVDVGAPGRVEGAAGSRYVTVPADITAVGTDGVTEAFTGTYTLRRSVVDGASEEQRRWRIHTAAIQQVR